MPSDSSMTFLLQSMFGLMDKLFRRLKNFLPLLSYQFGTARISPFPNVVYVSVNNVCNANCVMCDIGLKNKNSSFYQNLIQNGRSELSLELLRKLLSGVRKYRPIIHINSTEPLLYRNLIAAIQLVKRAGLELWLTTNGILLEKWAEELVTSGVDRIFVSIDGTEEVHDKIRGSGCFAKAAAGIRAVRLQREKARSMVPTIQVNTTISNLNGKNLFQFARYAIEELCVDHLTFSHMNFVTEEMAACHNRLYGTLGTATMASIKVLNPSDVDVESLHENLRLIRESDSASSISYVPHLASLEEVRKYYTDPSFIVSRKKCLVPWRNATLQPNGEMIVLHRCFHYCVGNLYEHSFQQIWNGQRYRTFRRSLKSAGLFPVCSRCCGAL